MIRGLQYLVIALALCACTKITEPVLYGSYYVENLTASPVRVEATMLYSDPGVLIDSIQPGATELLVEVSEGSGGHVQPSNFLSALIITGTDSLGAPVVIYSGVVNADWRSAPHGIRRTDFTLTIE